MTSVKEHIENGLMPDSNWGKADPIDRIDWPQIVELRTGGEPVPRAAESQEI